MAGTEGRVRLKVYLDGGHGEAEIFVSPATKCRDIVQRLQRQVHSPNCCLVEIWQGCERLVPENESVLGTLLDWGSDLDDVKFHLHAREEPLQASQSVNGTISQRLNGFREEKPIPRDVLLGGSRMSMSELREIAARQQQEIATKEKELKTRQIQAMELKRKAQNKPQNLYIQELSAKTEEQQERLKKLRDVQDEMESYKLSNAALVEELDHVRSLFMKKEKELAIAVAKVESLTQQLDEQRKGWSPSSPAREKTQQHLELERLRKELMMRNELNHQQSVQIQSQKQLLAEKHKELFELDAQIESYTGDLKTKRPETNGADMPSDQKNGTTSLDDQNFIEMNYENFVSIRQKPGVRASGVDPESSNQNQATRGRSRNSMPLETLVEVEEEISHGRASSKSSKKDLIQGPGPPKMSRVTSLKSRFEQDVNTKQRQGFSSRYAASSSKNKFAEDFEAMSSKTFPKLSDPAQRVEHEETESPPVSPILERFDLDSIHLKNEEREADYIPRSDFIDGSPPKDQSLKKTDIDLRDDSLYKAKPQPEYFPLKLEVNSMGTPWDEGSGSAVSSPSSLSSLSSVSSNSSSPKAAMFAVTGLISNGNSSQPGKRDTLINDSCRGEPLRLAKPKDFRSFRRQFGDSSRGQEFLRQLNPRQVKTEAMPTKNESVGPPMRTTLLDFSRTGMKPSRLVEVGSGPVSLSSPVSETPQASVLKPAVNPGKIEKTSPLEFPVSSSLLKSVASEQPSRLTAESQPRAARNDTANLTESKVSLQKGSSFLSGIPPPQKSVDVNTLSRQEKNYFSSSSPDDSREKCETEYASESNNQSPVPEVQAAIDRLQPARLVSNSISVCGQSSLTKITVTPSPAFYSGKTDILEKRSPIPSSKRTRLMTRGAAPLQSLPDNLPLRSKSEKENSRNDNKVANDNIAEEEPFPKKEKLFRETLHGKETDGGTLSSPLYEQEISRPKSPETSKKSRESGRQVVSSVSVQLSCQSQTPSDDKLEENYGISLSFDKTPRASTKSVAEAEFRRARHSALQTRRETVPMVTEGDGEPLHSIATAHAFIPVKKLLFADNEPIPRNIEGKTRQIKNVNQANVDEDDTAGELELSSTEEFPATSPNNSNHTSRMLDFCSGPHNALSRVKIDGFVKSKPEAEVPRFKSIANVSSPSQKTVGFFSGSNVAKPATNKISFTAEQKLQLKKIGKISQNSARSGVSGDLSIERREDFVESKEDGTSTLDSSLGKVESMVRKSQTSSMKSSVAIDNDVSVVDRTVKSAGDHADISVISPVQNVTPEQSNTSSVLPLSINRGVDSTLKLARKGEGKKKKARHVSLDPHAVLLDAAVEGELELVRQVIQEVDDPSKPNGDGITALHNAVCAGHSDVVRFLVEYGCDINSPDSHGWTPLHCAAATNSSELARFFIEHGACVLATTSLEKKTPLQCCERGLPGFFNCMKYLNDTQQNFGVVNEGRVFTLYSYTANEEDELSFECGDELVVLKRGDASEKEWWWASNKNGEAGYIPRNLLGLHPRVEPEV